jgi:hypothetical protein
MHQLDTIPRQILCIRDSAGCRGPPTRRRMLFGVSAGTGRLVWMTDPEGQIVTCGNDADRLQLLTILALPQMLGAATPRSGSLR